MPEFERQILPPGDESLAPALTWTDVCNATSRRAPGSVPERGGPRARARWQTCCAFYRIALPASKM